eukprot:COSAG02_NODE_43848_length_371_cov_0.761029_1_plen_23_part_01
MVHVSINMQAASTTYCAPPAEQM